ncbi:MAG: FAD-dependent monooxygenase [Sphingomonas fennica]
MRRADTLIAGAGPAGCAAAIALVGAGERPLLIDRARHPRDVVCGGFLGWDALALLDRIGVDAAALGAHPIRRVRIVAGTRIVEAALPRPAAGLSRRVLDGALAAAAVAAGAGLERGIAIRRVDPAARRLALADGAVLDAERIVVATGKHDLRGIARPSGDAIGLRRRLVPTPTLARALAGTIELHLLPHGYAGLLLLEDGAANLCLSVGKAVLKGRDPDALIAALDAPLLAERAAGGGDAWLAVAGVPYGWRAEPAPAGIARIGDQAAVIASLAGDGVAIALASGRRVADAAGFRAAARRPLAVAGALRTIAERPALAGAVLPLLGRLPGVIGLLARATRIADPDRL